MRVKVKNTTTGRPGTGATRGGTFASCSKWPRKRRRSPAATSHSGRKSKLAVMLRSVVCKASGLPTLGTSISLVRTVMNPGMTNTRTISRASTVAGIVSQAWKLPDRRYFLGGGGGVGFRGGCGGRIVRSVSVLSLLTCHPSRRFRADRASISSFEATKKSLIGYTIGEQPEGSSTPTAGADRFERGLRDPGRGVAIVPRTRHPAAPGLVGQHDHALTRLRPGAWPAPAPPPQAACWPPGLRRGRRPRSDSRRASASPAAARP